MHQKVNKIALFGLIISAILPVLSQTQNIKNDSQQIRVSITTDQFSDIQKIVDEQVQRGYQILNVSYRSSLKNLRSKGNLDITLQSADPQNRYEYRSFITEFRTS